MKHDPECSPHCECSDLREPNAVTQVLARDAAWIDRASMPRRKDDFVTAALARQSAELTAERDRLREENKILLAACKDTLTRLEWWAKSPTSRSLDNGFLVLKRAIERTAS